MNRTRKYNSNTLDLVLKIKWVAPHAGAWIETPLPELKSPKATRNGARFPARNILSLNLETE